MKKLVLALAAVALIATPALADFSFYGSARVATFYTNTDTGAAATPDVKNFDVDLQNNSRFGAKATTGDVAGRVELGLDDNAGGTTRTYLRLVYGEVKLGDGTLLVGQNYTPYTKLTHMVSSVDQGNEGFGATYDGRNTQITYTMNNGLYVSALDNLGGGVGLTSSETIIPKLNIGYKGKAADVSYNVGAAYQTYETAGTTDIASYLIYLNGDAKFGDFGLIYGLHYGKNLNEFGIAGRPGVLATVTDDVTCYGGMLEAGINGFYVGVGYTADESDATGAETDDQMVIYGNYGIQVAKGFTITPEVAYWDFMDTAAGVDGGSTLYVGAKWQLDF